MIISFRAATRFLSSPITFASHGNPIKPKKIVAPVSKPMDAGGYSLDRTPNLRHTHISSLEPSPYRHRPHATLQYQDPKYSQWINTHTTPQFSDREKAIMGGQGNDDTTPKLFGAIKDTTHSPPNHCAGTRGKKDSVFDLCETSGKVHTVLFVCGLRLDLASFTIVIDTAVVLLPEEVNRLLPLLQTLEQANPSSDSRRWVTKRMISPKVGSL
ncbi:hypothetical protein FRC06_004187 [Ceratobasidium sp. 370]|nr:hypothetical protein FRC06_004187 [Ceratobasidium sp. 370]